MTKPELLLMMLSIRSLLKNKLEDEALEIVEEVIFQVKDKTKVRTDEDEKVEN